MIEKKTAFFLYSYQMGKDFNNGIYLARDSAVRAAVEVLDDYKADVIGTGADPVAVWDEYSSAYLDEDGQIIVAICPIPIVG